MHYPDYILRIFLKAGMFLFIGLPYALTARRENRPWHFYGVPAFLLIGFFLEVLMVFGYDALRSMPFVFFVGIPVMAITGICLILDLRWKQRNPYRRDSVATEKSGESKSKISS